jgi:SAM-dependent methyltransferase
MPEVDLDALAAGYDHRPISEAGRGRARMAARKAALGSGSLVVDVGGGRGRHARVFAATGAAVVVVDRSMAAAVHVDGVEAVVGDARCLPIAGGSADLVYFHLSIHYGGWEESLAEAVRVVRPAGRIWIWTLHPEHHRSSFLARWFPSVGPIDEARFPEPSLLDSRLADLGCGEIEITESSEEVLRSAADWIAAVEAGFVSTLQILPPGELAAGLRRFRTVHPDPGEILRYGLRYVSVSAVAPSLA